jgi:hypothetical protein
MHLSNFSRPDLIATLKKGKKKGDSLTIRNALISGADERIRTADLLITNQLLYHLSYIGIRFSLNETQYLS